MRTLAGSLTVGTSCEWRGLKFDLSSRTAVFLPRWIQRVNVMAASVLGTEVGTVRFWWRALGYIMYANGAADRPLAALTDVLSFFASVARGLTSWDSQLRVPAAIRDQLVDQLLVICRNSPIHSPVMPLSPPRSTRGA